MDWIYWTKLAHTLIFFFASGCIVYVVYCGIAGKSNRYLWGAMGIVLAIGVIYVANGFECPLATLIHWLAGRRDVSDIFFPDWFANKIMPVSTVLYLMGVVLVSRNLYRDRKSNERFQRSCAGLALCDTRHPDTSCPHSAPGAEAICPADARSPRGPDRCP
jgi:hypothetical protein